MFNYVVSKKQDGISLLDFFKLFHLGKNKINYLIDNKKVLINDEIITSRNFILKYLDIINIDTSYYDYPNYKSIRYNLKIIYEDDYIIAIDKPYGVIIYDDKMVSLASYVAYYYEKTNQNIAVRHVHRLDKDTTGIIIYAKDIISHSYLSYLFEHNEIKKEYYALVKGVITKNGTVDIGISKNRHENGKMIANINGDQCLTKYQVIKNYDDKTLLNVEIKNGRTHQIRVHMAYIKHPLVSDALYGEKIDDTKMHLDCHHIGFYDLMINKYLSLNLPIRYTEEENEKNI